MLVVAKQVFKSVRDKKLQATDNCLSPSGVLMGRFVGVSLKMLYGGLDADGGALGTVGKVVAIPDVTVGEGFGSSLKDVNVDLVLQFPVPQ